MGVADAIAEVGMPNLARAGQSARNALSRKGDEVKTGRDDSRGILRCRVVRQ
jgi:hypothetical protein